MKELEPSTEQQSADPTHEAHDFMKESRERRQAEEAFLSIGLEDGQSWFFWCLKGANISYHTQEPDGWEWPPRLSGRIAAKDKKDARQKIAQEFGEDYPMRVLDKDRVKYPFLLYLEPLSAGNSTSRYIQRFMPKSCSICGREFTTNDRYNDRNDSGRGADTNCSEACYELHRLNQQSSSFTEGFPGYGGHQAVIYCITHKPTQKRYIGKTSQAFTLRWYQHMYQPGTTEFHKLIKSSAVTDWTFEVLEATHSTIPESILRGTQAYERAVLAREQYWIDYYDTINSGLNTATSIKAETIA